MKNTALLCCTANQAGTGHKLHFQPKNQAMAKLAAINNTNGGGTAEVWCRQFRSVSYTWYYHISSWKIQLCSVVPPTKSAQAISSIFSLNIQLGPNWQQSTTTIAVAWLRCDGDSFGVYLISLILSYKVSRNTAFLLCSSNQVSTDHPLYRQASRNRP